MEKDVCLKLKKRCIKHNQYIEGENYFPDGSNGEFDTDDNINTDMDNVSIDNILYLNKGASLQLDMNAAGTIVIEGDTTIELKPDQEYYITAFVYESIDPPPMTEIDYFIKIDKTGWSDAVFTVIKSFRLNAKPSGTWQKLVAKLVTGTDKFGKIKLVQSGSYVPIVDGETFHIDSVSISAFIPYFGDKVIYHEEVSLPVQNDIDATILYKIRDLTKPNFIFQRSRTRSVVIPSTQETEKYFGFSHRTGSIRGEKTFKSEYIARLEVDGIDVLSGLFTFDELNSPSCKNSEYKGKILSDNRTWISLLEKQRQCDLDWTEYDIVLSIDNIAATWANNGDDSLFVLFPFETRSIPVVVGDTYKLESHKIIMGHFIKPFLRKIFRHIGYEIEFKGEFLNSEYFRDIILTGNSSFFVPSGLYYGWYAPMEIYQGFHLGTPTIQLYDTVEPDYEDSEFDPFNYINGNSVEKVAGFELYMTLHFETWTGTAYSSPQGDASLTLAAISAYDGQTISVEAEFVLDTVIALSTDHAYWIEVRFYAGATLISTQYIYDPDEPRWYTDTLTIIQVVDEGDGDWRIDYEFEGDSFEHYFGASMMYGTGDEEFFARLRKPSEPNAIGYSVSLQHDCENTLKDYVHSIAMCFNLMHITNEKTKVVSLYQRDDFYKLGTLAIDVEDLAVEGEINQVRLAGQNSQKFLFSYKPDDEDIWFGNFAPNNFGNGSYQNSGGNKTIESVDMTEGMIFSATMNWEPVIDMWIPRYQNEDAGGVFEIRLTPRILHYDGLISLPTPSEFELSTNQILFPPIATETYTEYPRATFVGHGTNLAFHDYESVLGLINVHWKKELDIIANSRLLSAYFLIKIDFIRKLDYSKFWKFQDVLFLLNAIVDFNYIEPGITKVELVPINTFYGTDTTC